MQLKMSTDYAIRIIVYLAQVKKASSQELADKLHISQNYIRKLIRQPEMNKFIHSEPGIHGGLSLKQKAEDISLLDIIHVTEKTSFISCCIEDEENCAKCTSFDKDECLIRICYSRIQENIDKELSETKITSLLHDNNQGGCVCS